MWLERAWLLEIEKKIELKERNKEIQRAVTCEGLGHEYKTHLHAQ